MVDLSLWFKKRGPKRRSIGHWFNLCPTWEGATLWLLSGRIPGKWRANQVAWSASCCWTHPCRKDPGRKSSEKYSKLVGVDVNKTQRNEILGLQNISKKPTNTERHKPTVFWFCNVPRTVGDLVYIFWVLRIVKRRLISPAGWRSNWRKKSTGGLAFKRCHKNTWRCIEIFETYWKVKLGSPLQKKVLPPNQSVKYSLKRDKSIGNKRLENARYLSRNGRQRAWEPE